MDMIRYPYVADAQFDSLGEVLAPLRWYPAKAGAVRFPGRHSFGSAVWQRNIVPQPGGVGEIRPSRAPFFVSPAIPGCPDGLAFDGDEAWFRDGQPEGVAGLTRSSSGIPLSCVVVPPPVTSPCDTSLRTGTWAAGGPAPWNPSLTWVSGLGEWFQGFAFATWNMVCAPSGDVVLRYLAFLPGPVHVEWSVMEVQHGPPMIAIARKYYDSVGTAPETLKLVFTP